MEVTLAFTGTVSVETQDVLLVFPASSFVGMVGVLAAFLSVTAGIINISSLVFSISFKYTSRSENPVERRTDREPIENQTRILGHGEASWTWKWLHFDGEVTEACSRLYQWSITEKA